MKSAKDLADYLKEIGVLKSSYLISAFSKIDRIDFVTEEFKHLAYHDEALPILKGQTISQPYTVAFMLELLDPRPGEKIMDIGAGSGWTTALLAYVVSQNNGSEHPAAGGKGKVFAFERIPEVCDFGKQNVAKYNFFKKGVVEWHCKNAAQGLEKEAPFDKILVSARLENDICLAWKNQLKTGGVIVSPIGNSIIRYVKTKNGNFKKEEFPGFVFVPFVEEHAPAAKDPNWAKPLIIFFVLLFILASVISYLLFAVPSFSYENKIFLIEKNQSLKEISKNLAKEKIIRYPVIFETLVKIKGQERKIKAGKYIFEKPSSLNEILNTILAGPVIESSKIIIQEGLGMEKIGEVFEKNGFFTKKEWLEVVEHPAKSSFGFFPLLQDKPDDASLEGYLFPDTYFLDRNMSAELAAKFIIANLESKIDEKMRKDIKTRGLSFFEVLTMASLIEKESFDSFEERQIISGILWKRIDKGMPLQADATLAYLTGKPSSKLTEQDLNIDSPYNTYKYPGLPAGPITNPGLDSIKAAIYPKDSPYLYYLHDRKGRIHYAKTFKEHLRNKAKYLR